jgi:nitrite reductase/ring-hydroxylating ferredoxin subunit
VSDNFVPAIRVDEVAPGGMKALELDGREIVICNSRGRYYAIARRCGHMNSPLELGTLDGEVVTCPMHCAQFSITSGQALCGPVPGDASETVPPLLCAFLQHVDELMKQIRTESIRTYETKVEAGWVHVAP